MTDPSNFSLPNFQAGLAGGLRPSHLQTLGLTLSIAYCKAGRDI
jgi:hypothetical protein